MGFSAKQWENDPSLATPRSAAALTDQETRLGQYADDVRRVYGGDPDPYVAGSSFASFPRIAGYYEVDTTTGNNQAELGCITAPHDLLAADITMWCGNTASSGASLAKMGLWHFEDNGDLTVVAETAHDATLFTSTNTIYTRSFVTPYQMVKGERYAMGMVGVGYAGGWALGYIFTDGDLYKAEPWQGVYTDLSMTDIDDIPSGNVLVSSYIPWVMVSA